MSTIHPLISDEDLAGMIEDLQRWPNTAIDNGSFELSTSPFLTFYFHYDPAHYLRATLDMVDVYEAFERLVGRPFTIATHPSSERPHRYGSVRLGDLRDWARKTPLDKAFTANFTDQANHQSSPTHSAYLWREPTIGDQLQYYSSIQFYFRWQWWLDNRDDWRKFVLDSIARLMPAQVYSGFAMANPLEFGMRSEVAVWDRALTPHFFGLDTDYPFAMDIPAQLGSGIRPPTWGFFLSDIWREKLAISRDDVVAHLADPRIRIDTLSCGQWIELGPQPELYPVEEGVPELPVMLNHLLRRIRHPQLDLVGAGEWDGDPNERFDRRDTQRWLCRFDDDSDWPTPEIRGRTPSPAPAEPTPTHVVVGEDIPSDGWWYTLAKTGSRQYFKAGQPAPAIHQGPSRGRVIWQRDIDQRPPEAEAARQAETGQPAPRGGQWRGDKKGEVLCVVAKHEALPPYQGRSLTWHWMHDTAQSAAVRVRSGQPCPYPGTWTCEEHPTGPQSFAYQAPLPQVNGQDVTWALVSFLR
ncbi:type VI immunity family protein [Achromobacter sp. ESBL13]|uniref:type VI immunity family protein n=1 Tax=Achromobacter sp. ESBL13 TaxID=3077328 RepID=UPI002FCC60CE